MERNPQMDHFLQELIKQVFDTTPDNLIPVIKRSLVSREISLDYVVEQFKIGLKDSLGKWIIEAWEENK